MCCYYYCMCFWARRGGGGSRSLGLGDVGSGWRREGGRRRWVGV
jgi:hypothetical protein